MVWVEFEPTTPRTGGRSADHYTRLAALLVLGEVLMSFSVYKQAASRVLNIGLYNESPQNIRLRVKFKC